MSSKDEKTAIQSAYLASFLYLFIGIIPLMLATYIRVRHPSLLLTGDHQLMIPVFVQTYMPEFLQLLFFGSLASAIMSTASGALLAPSAIMSENVFQKIFPTHSESSHLRMSKFTVLLVGFACIFLALQDSNVYTLVSESSSIGLVSLLVPFVGGIWLKKQHPSQAIGSMVLGLLAWLSAKYFGTDINPVLYGLLASIMGWFLPAMVIP
jgi:Na+/proline symporter